MRAGGSRARSFLAAALALAPAAAAADDGVFQVAVVVGSGASPAAGVAPLRYADDDALASRETFALLGARTILLVHPDAETTELHRDLPERRPVTRVELESALGEAFEALAAARSAGRRTRLYFVYAGHGDTAGGRPFLQVGQSRVFRDDLALWLRRSPADANHVIIDACQASLFVQSRGPGGQRQVVGAGFSRSSGAAWPQQTGLLTARSSGGQTHEWTEYQAGIFSHEIRSGLLGGADADRDGRVTYRELGAFVRRANEAIANRKYRPEVITLAPEGNLDAVLAELPDGPLLLELGSDGGRAFVETERGVRLLDVHPDRGLALRVRLPTNRGPMFVQRPARDLEFRIEPRPGRLQLSELTARPAQMRARGAAHEAFRALFSRPFDRAAVATFQGDVDLEASASQGPATRRWLPWAVTGAGVATSLAAFAFGLQGHRLSGQATDGRRAQQLGPEVTRYNRAAMITGGAGVALTVVGLGWLWWSSPEGQGGEP